MLFFNHNQLKTKSKWIDLNSKNPLQFLACIVFRCWIFQSAAVEFHQTHQNESFFIQLFNICLFEPLNVFSQYCSIPTTAPFPHSRPRVICIFLLFKMMHFYVNFQYYSKMCIHTLELRHLMLFDVVHCNTNVIN